MKKLFSVMLSVIMATMMLFPAFAAQAADPAVNATNSTVTFKKQLNLTKYAADETVIPTLTFTYTITPGAAKAAVPANPSATPATPAQPAINAGVAGATVGTATFATADLTGTANTKNVAIDFSGCTFPEPGIYRYILQENANTNTATGVDGAVTYDTTYYAVDVYVKDVSGVKSISNAIMYELASATAEPVIEMNGNNAVYADNTTKKKDTIENDYDIYDLTLTKTVTGAMGEKDKDFPFTVTFANGPKSVTLKGEINGTATTLAFDAAGTATATFNLKHGQSAEFWALPEGCTYTIVEGLSAADKASYEVTITGATDNGTTDTYTGSGSMAADTNVTYTNNRDEITPTGLFMMYGPYALMMVVAAALAMVFFRKKRTTLEEDFA